MKTRAIILSLFLLLPAKTYIKHFGYYFFFQWVVGLVLFIATKRK